MSDQAVRPRVLVSIIIPTRNEEANVLPLMARLDSALGSENDWEVIFVDDSDDGTPDVLRSAQYRFPLKVEHRDGPFRRGGLAGAVIRGFDVANGLIIVIMDGDLQHPPELLPSLVAPIEAGNADIAVASRYVVGGSASGLSNPIRRVASAVLKSLATRALPRVREMRDPLSGYFAVRRSVIEKGPDRSQGFKVLLDVMAYGTWDRYVEVPFQLDERWCGESKAGAREVREYIRQLWRIRSRQARVNGGRV